MGLINKIFSPLLFVAVIISTVASFVMAENIAPSSEALKPLVDKHEIMCYDVAFVSKRDEQLWQLKTDLENLEALYSEGKITSQVYQTRKSTLQKQIENLEK